MHNPENILNDYSNQDILNYIDGKGDDVWRNQFEQAMAHNPFLADAVDGIKILKEQQQLNDKSKRINTFIKANTVDKKSVDDEASFPGFVYIAILLILIIAVVAWYVIYYSH